MGGMDCVHEFAVSAFCAMSVRARRSAAPTCDRNRARTRSMLLYTGKLSYGGLPVERIAERARQERDLRGQWLSPFLRCQRSEAKPIIAGKENVSNGGIVQIST